MSQNTQTLIKTTVLALVSIAVSYGLVAQDKATVLGTALVGVVTALAALVIPKFERKK